MMKNLLFIVLVLVVSFGCDKQKKHAKFMDGTWTIAHYTQISGVGFRTEYAAEGSIAFEDLGNGNLLYAENFSYYDGTSWIPLNRNGEMLITGDNSKSFEMTLTSPSVIETSNNNIHVVSKDDLKIEFHENGVGHVFVLQKN